MSVSEDTYDYERFVCFGPKHSGTTTAALEVKKMILPDTAMVQTKQVCTPSSSLEKDLDELSEDEISHTYERINIKGVPNSEGGSGRDGDGASEETGGAGTDTDSGLSGSLKGDARKGAMRRSASGGLSEGSLSPLCHSPPNLGYAGDRTSKLSDSPDIGVGMESGTSNNVWKFEEEGREEEEEDKEGRGEEERGREEEEEEEEEEKEEEYANVQFKIEEHIEEVTTHHHLNQDDLTSTEESTSSPSGSSSPEYDSCSAVELPAAGKIRRRKRVATKVVASNPTRNLLPAFGLPSLTGSSGSGSGSGFERVPFPEFGVDLLQGPSSTIDGGPSEHVIESVNWKENWLFRSETTKRARSCTRTSAGLDTITMLIPNPESQVGPTIGNREIDELSELSDRDSNSSFDMWSDESEHRSATTPGTLPPASSPHNGDFLLLVGEISAEFGQKDQEYLEDVSVLDRRPVNRSADARQDTTGDLNDLDNLNKSDNFNKLDNLNVDRRSNWKNISPSPKANSKVVGFPPPSHYILPPPNRAPLEWDSAPGYSSSVWFEARPKDEGVPTGRALRLACQVGAKKACRVSWYLEGDLLEPGNTVHTWRKGDVYTLNMFEMCARTAGTYMVAAYTQTDCVWARCHATCTDVWRANKMPRISLTLCDLTAEEGDDVIIECQVSGHPEPKVTFVRNSVPVTPKSAPNSIIENDQYGTWSLRLTEVTIEDKGHLKAIASNSLGHAMTSCDLQVLPEGHKPRYCGGVSENQGANTTSTTQNSSRKKKKSLQQVGHNINNINKNNNNNAKRSSLTTSSLPNNFENSNPSSNNLNASTDYQTYNLHNNSNNNNNNNSYYNLKNTYMNVRSDEGSTDAIDGHEITINGCMFQPPKPGTIAEREHRKWLDAKPLPNNPYSPERLAVRLGQSPTRFPSMPAVYKETTDEGNDSDPAGAPTHLTRRALTGSSYDLSRYSRDYHVYGVNRHSVPPRTQTTRANSCSLVTVEAQKFADWKEELKDIKLNVGQKVADLQKTIDAVQHEWHHRRHHKGPASANANARSANVRRNKFLNHPHQKLSASCINLTSPVAPVSKQSWASASGAKSRRHLVYSSTEALDGGKAHKDLWRTVSVDTLDAPLKFRPLSSGVSIDPPKISAGRGNPHSRFGSKESVEDKRYKLKHTFSGPLNMMLSDSDDSSLLTTPYYPNNPTHNPAHNHNHNPTHNPTHNHNPHPKPPTRDSDYPQRRVSAYYSEDSFKEESDTEGSLWGVEGPSPTLPSVKALASKFDSLKASRNRAAGAEAGGNRSQEKTLRSSRNQNAVIIEHRDQNSYAPPPSYNRKYNNKIALNEVHHSLTARSVSRSFREGLRQQSYKSGPHLEPVQDQEYQLNSEGHPSSQEYQLNQEGNSSNHEYQLNSECDPNHQEYHLNQAYNSHIQEYQVNPECHSNNQEYQMTQAYNSNIQEYQTNQDYQLTQEYHPSTQEYQPSRNRDTSSPEHLGIPSSPAFIPNRHCYPYPPHSGDTSDDSMVAGLAPRKNYRKKSYSNGRA